MSLISGLLQPINDVTTSFDPVPKFVAGKEYRPEFRPIQEKLYPDLRPLTIRGTGAEVFQRVLAAAQRQPNWKIVHVDEKWMCLQGEARTPLMRFVDDFVIEVRPKSDGAEIHMRSKSRLGRNDFGANYKRICEFFASIQSP
jgi:uncharacterized protein (DUF1499 family)